MYTTLYMYLTVINSQSFQGLPHNYKIQGRQNSTVTLQMLYMYQIDPTTQLLLYLSLSIAK
mgnify:CR=1 FL=1